MKTLNKTVLNDILQKQLDADLKANHVSGAAIMVAQNGEVLSQIYAGVKDPRTGEPLQPHTMFRLASMTKPIMAVAVMTMVEAGKIALDAPVEDYLPVFADMQIGGVKEFH